ncbi:Inner membrane transport permease YadH [Candidatus Annandia adelgestsuga]|uniref:Transport permease protein n=1 Tax=Candidatus Annandia adelgestsuga TaxID=1302411 RepID=A0A3S9J805_9ENTR|nr:ABC transporter permease [Candidatus Annandia adelgestsuga]AZP36362.1 Inner membrane transport permease YadH [Candidatus Annandia adelgestsuga]
MIKFYFISLINIIYKETFRFLKIWIQTIIPPLINITLYFIIFGNIMNKINKIEGFNYLQFIFPGLVTMIIINNSYNNVSSSFFSSKIQKNIEEIILSPISTNVLIMGYIGSSIIRSLIISLLIIIISFYFIKYKIYSWIIIFFIITLISILFSLIGLLNAIISKTFDNISLIPTLILTPLSYLSGIFYSINNLSTIWKDISLLNPITYMVSGLRYGFIGNINFISFKIILIILLSLIFLFYIITFNCLKKILSN